MFVNRDTISIKTSLILVVCTFQEPIFEITLFLDQSIGIMTDFNICPIMFGNVYYLQ